MRSFGRLYRSQQPSQEPRDWDRVRCAVCNYPGVPIESIPGESLAVIGSARKVETGTTYGWTNADDPVSSQDFRVQIIPTLYQACPFCGAERFLDGRRESGIGVR